MNQFWRVLGDRCMRTSFCNCKRTLVNLSQPHIYKKTWKEDELLQYLRDNVVYECDDHFITSLPRGIATREKTKWWDHDTCFISDVTLCDLIEKLRFDFRTKNCYTALYPGRNASGLTILTKNAKTVQYIKRNLTQNASQGNLVLTFLAVVLGRPDQFFTQDFGIKHRKTEQGFSTLIKDISIADKKCKRVSYQHEVLESAEHVSLVRVDVSSNMNDCSRHILAERCFSPVFGDFWWIRRRQGFMFGVPLVRDFNVQNTETSVLPPELHEKLQLERHDEKFVPTHLHLYSVRLPLNKGRELFGSVPPPEYFVWTCRQLGLNEIEKFSYKTTKRSEMSVA